jgi:hypothetical protein
MIDEPLVENVHYKLIPASDVNDQSWDVEIISGDFVETTIRFGNVAVNEVKDNMTFNFVVINTEEPEYINPENEDLQEYAGRILTSIIERSFDDDTIIMKERDDDSTNP